jgi:polysaccharide chain length determinant protein (PEP-CTERM system associated)
MALHQKANSVSLQSYVKIFWRRKWWLVIPLMLGIVVGYAVCFFIPPSYQSSTLILIELQKVPISYVTPTVPGTVDDRLRTISQQISSRTNLSKIIKEYNLYKREDVASTQRNNLLGRMQDKVKRILVQYGLFREEISTPLNQDEVPEEIIDRMRQDIALKVIGKEAFSVTYNGQNPNTVMRVTNTLALLLIEENLKTRERQAEGTSEFLASQLVEAERELQKQEHKLKEYQQQHREAMPAQLDANLRTLDRLQRDLNAIDDSIKSAELTQTETRKNAAEERRVLQELMLLQPTATTSALPPQSLAPKLQAPPKLEALKQELARLRMTFNENYPDIVSIKKQIEELSNTTPQHPELSIPSGAPAPGTNAELAALPSPAATSIPTPAATKEAAHPSREGRAQGTATAALPVVNSAVERKLATLRARRERIIAQMQKLEEYVNATPANEEKLAELMRDHRISLKNYQSILEERLQAKISENLEKKQQSEQFRILEPANFPTEPARPNRPLIVGIGGALGGGLGAGLILLLNYFNPVSGKPEDIYGTSGIPVLVTIPRYHTDFGKDHRLLVLHESDSFIAEQYRTLYTKIHNLSKGNAHKIFAITSALQNEGKTVTALNLAVVMARDFGKRTLVLEGDFRRPSIPLYLNVDLEEGLVDILSSKSGLQPTMVPVANTLVPFADDNLAVLPAVCRTQSSTSFLSSPRMRELLDLLREHYDFILIDSPPILPFSDMNIFEEVVDGMVMIVRAESTTKDTVTKALDTLGTDKVLGIVLNDVYQAPFSHYRYNYKYDSNQA